MPLRIFALTNRSISPLVYKYVSDGYARPRYCIQNGRLVESELTNQPYIAISYVWDPSPSFVPWEGRPVTEQALCLAKRLSKHTSLALWIDAICIPQDDEPVKMDQLAKMADIYRGAVAVLCMVSEVVDETCELVPLGAMLTGVESYRALEKAGDIHGMYMFATHCEDEKICRLFGSRWWTRAWTFQEAILNEHTFLVGNEEQSIRMQDVLKLAGPISRRAATRSNPTLGQIPNFWDSVMSMAVPSNTTMELGEAMSCVWRRQSTVTHDLVYSLLGVCGLETVRPDYQQPFAHVLALLVEAASAKGDFSWLRWSHLIDHEAAGEGMRMVPVPESISKAVTSSITKWHSVKLLKLPVLWGGEKGIPIPHRSTGVVRWQSLPQEVKETVKTLQERGHSSADIWNLLFGLQVGLAADVNRAVGASDISVPLLTLATWFVDGYRDAEEMLDMVGEKPFTPGIGFTSFAAIAAKVWRQARLVIMSSQGGTTVVPENSGTGQARIHKLPIESQPGVCLALVVYDNTRSRVTATGLMIETKHAGSGAWQLTRFG